MSIKVKSILLGASLISFGACAMFGGQTLPPGGAVTESVVTVCSTFSASLKAVTPMKATMTANDISIVDKSILFATPICKNPASYNSNGAIAGLKAEIKNLVSIFKTNGGK
jgi:hypothetical protein